MINIHNGSIIFTSKSVGWNETANSGSIIDHAVLTGSISILETSPKIASSSFEGIDINGNATLSQNIIGAVNAVNGSPHLFINTITGIFAVSGGSPLIENNTLESGMWITRGVPTITGNRILDEIHADTSGGDLTLTNNEISSKNNNQVLWLGPYASLVEVSGNRITGNTYNVGIVLGGGLRSASIVGNQISGCKTGINAYTSGSVWIAGNTINNNENGLYLSTNASVQGNDISQNTVGIVIGNSGSAANISGNNIANSITYNFKLQSANNVTVANNWWGTTDPAAISQTIYDNKNDFNVGTVTFTPFLTEPATINPSPEPTPTQTPTSSPSPTSTATPTNTPTPASFSPTNTPTQPPSSSLTPSASILPSPTPAAPESEIFAFAITILAAIVATLIVAVAVLWRKISQLQKNNKK